MCPQHMEDGPGRPVESRENLVIGAGKMGNHYVQKLLDAGVPSEQISVIDIDVDKLAAIQEKFPGISVGTEMPVEAPKHAFVLSNSPAHLQNLEELAALAGIAR